MLPLAASPVQSIQFIIAIVEGAISTNEEKKHSSFLEMGISVGRISFFQPHERCFFLLLVDENLMAPYGEVAVRGGLYGHQSSELQWKSSFIQQGILVTEVIALHNFLSLESQTTLGNCKCQLY